LFKPPILPRHQVPISAFLLAHFLAQETVSRFASWPASDLARLLLISPGHCSVRFCDLLLQPVFHQERTAPSSVGYFGSFQPLLTMVEF
jgi:hypothetical protein